MAIPQEEIRARAAVVVPFPVALVRARDRRARMLARRRRSVSAVACALALTAGVWSLADAPRAPLSRAGAPRTVVVRPGQSLWDLAELYAAPGTDPRAYLASVTELNPLRGTPQPGARIRLP
jgi:hypothetical protein